jgi:5-methylthioadenosine/S-adenosylhomocysteine deaminase
MGRLALRAGWVIPVDDAWTILRDGVVLIEDGRIAAVGRHGEVDTAGAEERHFPRHALLPGLVNVHTHVAGCVFRGLTEDRTDGFYGFALPLELHFDADIVHRLSRLGIAEVLLAGCTVIHEIYHYSAETARAAVELGVRAQVAHKIFDTDLTRIGEGVWEPIPEEGQRRLAENLELYDRWHGAGDGRVSVRIGAHAVDTVSPGLMAQIREEAARRGVGKHIHVAQSPEEQAHMREAHGLGSIEYLAEQGFLGPDTVAAHITFASEREIALLAETDTPVAHCPAIVAKRGRFPMIRAVYDAGIRVGWGTDWVTMDPWDAMRFGIAGARLAYREISILSAREGLWRSTRGSAEVLGWADRIGSLEPGKQADMILVDMDQPHLAPVYDPITVLVYNASGRYVTHVVVAGDFVVSERRLLTGDASEIVAAGQDAAERVWRAGGLDDIGVGDGSRPLRTVT